MKKGNFFKMLCLLSTVSVLSGCTFNLPASVNTEPSGPKEPESVLTSEISSQNPGEDTSDSDSDWVKPETQNTKADFREILVSEAGVKEDAIVLMMQEDFDGDGEEEAFAMVGEETDTYDDQPVVSGDIWFVSMKDCKRLTESKAMGFFESGEEMTMGKTKYVLFDEVYATSLVTHVWYVENSDVKEAAFSEAGNIITGLDGDNRFRITDSSYDMTYDPSLGGSIGHTWKTYYFFYSSEDDMVYEYGGTDVDQDAASDFCGIDLIKDYLPKGDTASSLFIRGNGLLVMNYEHKDGELTDYYHCIYNFGEGYFVDDSGNQTEDEALAGIYREALCPNIANYPQIEGPDGTVYGE